MAKKDLKTRVAERAKNLREKGGDGAFYYVKDGTNRFRIVSNQSEPDKDWAVELIYFYLGKDVKGVVSPASFGKPCAIMEYYNKLKASKKESDREFATKMRPKQRFAVAVLKYSDEKGTEIDRSGVRLILLTKELYLELTDLYCDDDEGGDFTDRTNGYDIKITRTGKGQFDTAYTLRQCKPSKLPKEFRKADYDAEELLKACMPTYEKSEEYLETFLSGSNEEDEPEEKAVSKDKDKKKKKKRDDA